MENEISRRDFLKTASAGFLGAVVFGGIKMDSVNASSIEKPKTDIHLKGIKPFKMSVPKESLGDVDEKNREIKYPNAIKEGGKFKAENFEFSITYKGGFFNYKTFINVPVEKNDALSVGDTLPYLYLFQQNSDKDIVSLNSLTMPVRGIESKDIKLGKSNIYGVIPIVTAGSSSDIVDIGNKVSSGFEIERDNMLGVDKGYLSFALLQLTKNPNSDGSFGLQMLGVVNNTAQAGGVFLDDNLPEKEYAEQCNIGK